jgi:hypothetical protein
VEIGFYKLLKAEDRAQELVKCPIIEDIYLGPLT